MTILFGDVEAALIAYLDASLGPPVRTRVPKGTNPPYIIVQRLGGPGDLVTEAATVTVESWGLSDSAAHDQAQFARQAVRDLPGQTVNGIVFYRVAEFAGPARLADPTSGKPRFVFTVSITVRALTT